MYSMERQIYQVFLYSIVNLFATTFFMENITCHARAQEIVIGLVNTLDSGINIRVHLLISGLFSWGYIPS